MQGPFIKQNAANPSFPPAPYNNCRIKVYFLFTYTSVATNFIKKVSFWSRFFWYLLKLVLSFLQLII